jgi:hypothetical protein
MNIALIGCTRQKLGYPCPAHQLYSPSSLFRKARAYCERHYDAWYVLSAKHHLVHPDTVIAPYDLTLRDMSAAERRVWGRRVSKQLQALGDHVFYGHAGRLYLENLAGIQLVNVLEGYTIGKRLRWYNQQAAMEGWACP